MVMVERKPPNVSFPDWVERQIRAAESAGAFENLPGAGKPIPGIDRPQPDQAWVANYLKNEDTDAAPLLPPGLALAKEVEDLPERLMRERSEARVRDIVDDLNRRIALAHSRPQVVPPVRVGLVPVDATLTRWREARARITASAPPQAKPAAEPASPRRGFGWRPRREFRWRPRRQFRWRPRRNR